MMHAGKSIVNDLTFGYQGARYIFVDFNKSSKRVSVADHSEELPENLPNINDFVM